MSNQLEIVIFSFVYKRRNSISLSVFWGFYFKKYNVANLISITEFLYFMRKIAIRIRDEKIIAIFILEEKIEYV